MGYRLVRLVIRILLKLFYGRIDVVGRERIPATGPLIVAANHHNSVVDAMLIVATFPRALRVLANAPLFGESVVMLALGLPLALWGIACHAVPYLLVGRAVRWLGRTSEEEATDKMAAGLVFYPLFWSLEEWACWRLAAATGLGIFLILLVPAGLLALAWRERLERVGRQRVRAVPRRPAPPRRSARGARRARARAHPARADGP